MARPRDDYYYDDYDYPEERTPQRGYPDDYYEDYYYERRPTEPTYKTHKRPKRSKVWGAIDITVRILILIFLLIFFTMPQFEYQRNLFLNYLEEGLYHYKEIPDYMIFEIERDIVIETSPDTTVTSFTIVLEKPFRFKDENDNVVQDLQDLYTELPEGKGIDETSGRAQVAWEGAVDYGDTVEMKIFYKIKSAHIIWDISSSDSGDLDDIPDELKQKYGNNDWQVMQLDAEVPMANPYDQSLGTEFYRIHPTDPAISDLAEKLKGNEDNVLKIIKSFYDFLTKGKGDSGYSDNVECAYPDQFQMDQSRENWGGMPKPARTTLEDWLGDCDDQSFLFISMCRAVGIPARVEAGALWNTITVEWGGHGWAEVYIPLKDGTHAWCTIDAVNDLYLERDPFRFTDYKGSGQPGRLEQYYSSFSYHYDGGTNVLYSEVYTSLSNEAIPGETLIHV